MAEWLWPALLALFAVGVPIARFRRSRRMVNAWARANNLAIVKRHWPALRLGPWFLLIGKQAVRYVTVRDVYGQDRRCWLKLGSLWGLTDDIEVRWEDESGRLV